MRDGSLTNREANRLEHGQNRIDRYEARARSDGVVTPGERNRIDGMQNRESRQIYADRHNDRTATGTTPTTPARRPSNGSHNWGNGGWQHGPQAGNTTPTTPTTGTQPTGGSRNGGWQHAPQAGNTTPTTPSTGTQRRRRLAQLGRQRRLSHAAGGGHAAAAGTGAASDHDARLQPEPVDRWPQLRWTSLTDSNDREAAIRGVGSPFFVSVHLALLVAPVGLAQFALQDLAGLRGSVSMKSTAPNTSCPRLL